MDKFEAAINCVQNPMASPADRRDAERYLIESINSSEGITGIINRLYNQTSSIPVKLICINLLQKAITTNEPSPAITASSDTIKRAIAFWPVEYLSKCDAPQSNKQ